ncbi:hypothetical protein BG844_13140 [Couchioplanes caeruleus subsp. caeruleus]|uniref:Uncharacterized protein n=1 Tax=Couchioplanes caeruleus subsp. caeruleus TaxID=56427 RepID=A0A1K0FLZ7_9ACTN|nr:hypothetical protein BG844_13140 [Couchioplanes caeruleus subsp. caeruleus]
MRPTGMDGRPQDHLWRHGWTSYRSPPAMRLSRPSGSESPGLLPFRADSARCGVGSVLPQRVGPVGVDVPGRDDRVPELAAVDLWTA